MGAEAAKEAIERAGIAKGWYRFYHFYTLSPDYYFPGCGVLVQRLLVLVKFAFDIRNQCSGFVYILVLLISLLNGDVQNILLIGLKLILCFDFNKYTKQASVSNFGDGAGGSAPAFHRGG